MSAPAVVVLRRIVVALDTSPHSLAALLAAADLAQGQDVELVGVFVEDVNWLRHGQTPDARVISRFGVTRTAVHCEEIQRLLATQAEMAARALARLAEARSLRWSFRLARGSPAEAVAAASSGADLVTLGRAGWPAPGRRAVGPVARRLLDEGATHTLVLSAGQRLAAPVALYLGAGMPELGAAALATALALRLGGELHVWTDTWEAERAARAALIDLTPHARFARLPAGEPAALQLARLHPGPGVLVLPHALVRAMGEGLGTLLERLDCPVLLAR